MIDPACGSGGMFVQSLKFIAEHQGNIRDISIFGQEKNPTTWKLAKMNLAIRNIDCNLGNFADDTFHNDLHKDLKADFILANPPFNISDWGQEKLLNDYRWKFGLPPSGNANFAWLQHIISKLSVKGRAAIILHNGSLSSNISNEGEIRKNIVENDLVDCIISMPTNLFYTVTIPCSIWILNKNKPLKNKGKILFINAMNLGTMVNRKTRELNYEEDIMKIAKSYHKYQNQDNYTSEIDFCKVVDFEQIKENDFNLSPSRYIERKKNDNTNEIYEKKMEELKLNLLQYFDEFDFLKEEIKRKMDLF